MAFNGKYFNFQIHHLIPEQILSGTGQTYERAADFLSSVDFDIESRGNKIALLINEQMRNAILVGVSNVCGMADASANIPISEGASS